MRPPPVILKGIHSNAPKWNRGAPIVGATGLRCGSQLPTISAIAAVAVSPASNLGVDITPASVNEDLQLLTKASGVPNLHMSIAFRRKRLQIGVAGRAIWGRADAARARTWVGGVSEASSGLRVPRRSVDRQMMGDVTGPSAPARATCGSRGHASKSKFNPGTALLSMSRR